MKLMSRSSDRSVTNRTAATVLVTATVSLPSLLIYAPAANAVTFRFDYGRSGASAEFKSAVEVAASSWSSVLNDDAVVDLRFEYTNLSEVGGSVLGGAQTSRITVNYKDYVSALLQDAVSTNDYSGLNSLQLSSKDRETIRDFQAGLISSDVKIESKTFDFLLDDQFKRSERSDNQKVQLTRAQAKALNIIDPNKQGLDAIIKLNDQVTWDFEQLDGVDGDKYDAVSVIQHEIGHALGVVSGVDTLDFLAATNAPVDFYDKEFSYLTPMDFYRYSDESAEQDVVDLTLGGEKFFSLDGGETAVRDEQGRVAYFSTGSESSGGDGYQGSHWQERNGDSLGIMDPALLKGETNRISQLDLQLLDTTGWDLEDKGQRSGAVIGLDVVALKRSLNDERQSVVNAAVAEWSDLPELEKAINNAAYEIDIKFEEELSEHLQKVIEKVSDKPQDREEELSKFYSDIRKESAKRNEGIAELPEDIAEVDGDVQEWLSLSTDKLAKELEDAKAIEADRLLTLVNATEGDERVALEQKLEAAFSQFVEKPDKVLEEFLKSSGFYNPIGYGRYRRWRFWSYLVSDDEWIEDSDSDDNFQYEAYDAETSRYDYLLAGSEPATTQATVSTASSSEVLPGTLNPFGNPSVNSSGLQPVSASAMNLKGFEASAARAAKAKDIPEPSSVLALFGIAVLGTAGVKRKKRE